jgi:hypothetical protein
MFMGNQQHSSGTWTCPAGVTSVTVEGREGSGKLLPQPKVTLVVVVVAHIQSEIQLRSQ